jgi:hypothetical protein
LIRASASSSRLSGNAASQTLPARDADPNRAPHADQAKELCD